MVKIKLCNKNYKHFYCRAFSYYNIDFIFKVFYDLKNEIEFKDLINFSSKFLV